MLFTLSTATAKTHSEERYLSLIPPCDVTQARSFRYREHLPFTRDGLWRIESGYVRTITWDDEGTISALGIWGTGEVVGHQLSTITPYQIECLTPVLVREIPLSDDCTHLLLSHLHQVETLLNVTSIKQTMVRLVKLLEWLSQRFGRLDEQGYLIDIPLTHQCISELIGATRVTVTRSLSELRRAGKIQQLCQHRILLQNFRAV